MPRGKMLHTKLYEEADKLAVHKLAAMMAEEKFRKKHLKDVSLNNLEMSAREHFGKLLDRMGTDDLLNVGAVAALTIIVQPLIKHSPEIIAKVTTRGPSPLPGGSLQPGQPGGLIGWLIGERGETQTETTEKNVLDDTISWVLAFGVACLIIKFGPEMLKSFNGVVGLATVLLI